MAAPLHPKLTAPVAPRPPAGGQARPQGTPPQNWTEQFIEIMQAQRLLTDEQAERVRRGHKAGGMPIEQAMTELGLATEQQVAQALAAQAGLPFVKINPLDLDLDVVTKAVTGPFARKHGMVAIGRKGDKVTIAVHNPFAHFPFDDLRQASGLEIERVVATRSDVERINRGFYDLKTSLTHAENQLRSHGVTAVDLGNQEFLSGDSTELDPAAAPVVKALDQILAHAFEQRASDIHFEPKREMTLVRLRIDGILHDVHAIPKIVYQAVVSRIKLLSGCNLAEKRRPQDGRIKRESAGREVELRVSTMPTAFGEKAVLRIFDPDILLKGIDDLGLSDQDFPKLKEFIARPNGIILVTGPTGSGKTTTLYSILKHLANPEVNIITIEDPIEMVFEDFNQVAVRPQIDVTFASALRTVLRQDPDIVMVGEIRDSETADHAVQAALTGHLVLSTLHTNDASSSITRLQDLGVPHFLITTTVVGIFAQRLVRENCKSCSVDYDPTEEEALALRVPFEKLQGRKFRHGTGCVQCHESGFRGRIGIFEVLAMSEKIRRLVSTQAGGPEIYKTAREEGLRTLREAALEKVLKGVTTPAEMVRVTGKT